MPEQPIEQQPPKVLAMVLADAILHDMATGKFIIQGTFSIIIASTFPWTHPVIAVYAAITNGHGKTPIKLRLADVDDSRDPVYENEAVVDFADPIVVAEMVMVLRNVVFPEPGEYCLQLYGAGTPLMERRLQVVPIPSADQP